MLVISTGVTLAALKWLGYQLHLFAAAYIGDQYDTLLNSWAIFQAIDNLLHRPFNLGYSTIFYGDPNSFGYTIAPYGIAIAVLPLYLLSKGNLVFTYNAYFVATFLLTAWGAYLLIRYLLKPSQPIAMLMGLMVGFAQFRFGHYVHVETLSTQFYLLALYCWHRLFQTPHRRWVVGLSVTVWFTLLSSGYLGMMLFFTLALILGYSALKQRPRLTHQFLVRLMGATALSLVLIVPFSLYRLGNAAFRGGVSYESVIAHSGRPGDWFSGNSQIYLGVVPSAGERQLFLGWTPIVLAFCAWRYRRILGMTEDAQAEWALDASHVVAVYGLLSVAGYLMTLGPQLRVGDVILGPLPYAILMQLPGLNELRVPARFIWLPITGTAVLGAYLLRQLQSQWEAWLFWSMYGIVALVLVIELTPFNGEHTRRISLASFIQPNLARPLRPQSRPINVPVYAWLAQQPFGTAIFQYPADLKSNYSYISDLTLHHQPMLNGVSSLTPAWWEQAHWEEFPTPGTVALLRKRGIQYILVHHEMFSAQAEIAWRERLQNYQSMWGEWERIGQFDQVEVYRVPWPQPRRTLRLEFDQAVPGAGWAGPEVTPSGETFQWMGAETATLDLPLAPDCRFDISFRILMAMAPDILNSLTLSTADQPLALTYQPDSQTFHGLIPLTAITADETRLAFQVNRIISPKEAGFSDDSRSLALAFDWLQVDCQAS